jgi:hemerythrin superfamily protein
MAEDTILSLMINHHSLLEVLFESFKDESQHKTPTTGTTLSEFMWEMKKHFFAEESAIFDLPPLKIVGVWEIIKQLKKEHVIMLENLQSFSDNLESIKEEDINNFHDLLENHRKIEELNLYPKLDENMLEAQKTQIISRINEIPMDSH